jgi:hypothetical protein
MTKRRFVLAVSILFVALALWLIRRGIVAHRSEVQREAAYQSQLHRFQHDLRLGAPRYEVASYLHAHRIAYNGVSKSFDVEIGEEPSDSIFCEKWDVYIELGFSHLKGQFESSPSDNLDSVSIRKIGTCL